MSISWGGPDMLLSLACHLGYAWCASRFLTRHLCGRPLEGRAFGCLLFCGRAMMTSFLQDSGIPYILYALCGHVLLTGLTMALFRAEREKKLLAAVLLLAMTSLLWVLVESLLCCAGLLFVRMTEGSRLWTAINTDVDIWAAVNTSAGIWADRVRIFLTYAVGMIGIERSSGPLASVFIDKRKSWYLSLTVPLACIVLLADIVEQAASKGIMVHSWGGYGLYEDQLFSYIGMCIFTGLALAAAGSLVFGMDKIDRGEKAREQYRSQVSYYQMMEEQYSQMERLRHDMKNHLLALENLVQERQWEQAGAYLRELTKAGSVQAGDEATGSPVIDALFYHKKRQAVEHGIDWKCDARLPADCPVKDMDLCIIMGNILDNAVEACIRLKEQTTADHLEALEVPSIRIYMGTVKKCLFLEVQNSTDLTHQQETGRSRKEEPGIHGLGLSNIRAVAAAYDGAVHMEVENGVFTLSVLLPMHPVEPRGPVDPGR